MKPLSAVEAAAAAADGSVEFIARTKSLGIFHSFQEHFTASAPTAIVVAATAAVVAVAAFDYISLVIYC